jgi:hypothetical protein
MFRSTSASADSRRSRACGRASSLPAPCSQLRERASIAQKRLPSPSSLSTLAEAARRTESPLYTCQSVSDYLTFYDEHLGRRTVTNALGPVLALMAPHGQLARDQAQEERLYAYVAEEIASVCFLKGPGKDKIVSKEPDPVALAGYAEAANLALQPWFSSAFDYLAHAGRGLRLFTARHREGHSPSANLGRASAALTVHLRNRLFAFAPGINGKAWREREIESFELRPVRYAISLIEPGASFLQETR